MYQFNAIDKYELAGKGPVYIVKNPHDCDDFKHLVGKTVLIDGVTMNVSGVERFTHCPPWREGENIGLFVMPNARGKQCHDEI